MFRNNSCHHYWHKNTSNCSWADKYNLIHWGQVTHICVSKLTIIGSDNGLSHGQRQAIIWTNAGILKIRTIRTNFSEIHAFSFKKMHFKTSSGNWRPFCLGLNELTNIAVAISTLIMTAVATHNDIMPLSALRITGRLYGDYRWIPSQRVSNMEFYDRLFSLNTSFSKRSSC